MGDTVESYVNAKHQQAMGYAELGNFAKALTYERAAAAAAMLRKHLEPTRSVLLRSAASLALQCEQYREAERLAAAGLVGDPPAEILAELREVMVKAIQGGKS